MFQQVEVSIRLVGAASHDLLVSYVVAAPMWKPTYRVVLPKDGKGQALLQAWAVVDNTSGEEWEQVQLALTSGAPIAFRYDLHTPREVERPDMTGVGIQRQAVAAVGETTYLPEPAPAPPPAAAAPSPRRPSAAPKASGPTGRSRSAAVEREEADWAADESGALGGLASGFDDGEFAREDLALDADALRRSTVAQARAETVAGQTPL
jgi:hypothetical protein